MPIGSESNGVPTTVTPDTSPSEYSSVQGPAPDAEIVANDVLAVILVALNIQKWAKGQFINGTVGGDYAPSDFVNITGAHGFRYKTGTYCWLDTGSVLQLDGTFSSDGTVNFTGGQTTFQSGSGLLIQTGNFHVSGTQYLDSGGALISSTGSFITSHGTVTVLSDGAISIAGTGTITGAVSLATGGQIRHLRVNGPDADHQYAIGVADRIQVAALSGDRVYKFLNTGAGAGSEVKVSLRGCSSSTYTVALTDDSNNVLATLKNASLYSVAATLLHDGTDWKLFGAEYF
jgi:hypothetical protein